MAVPLPFYLAVGDVIIEDGTGTTDYTVTGRPSFPEPRPDNYGGHVDAVRSFTCYVNGSSVSDVTSNLNALRRAAVRDEYLRFRHGSSGDVLECRILEANVSEDSYSPGAREALMLPVSVTLKTEPYWLGAWTEETNASGTQASASGGTSIPCHLDIPATSCAAITGEVDALFSLRACPTASGTFLAIGVKPEPESGYDYLDDYGDGSGTSDANAFGTYKIGESASAGYDALGTAPSIELNPNRGRHLLIGRADSNASLATAVTFKAASTVTGLTSPVYERVVTASTTNLIGYELGDVQIPCAAVPDSQEGLLAWSTCGDVVSNACGTSIRDVSASAICFVGQSFTASGLLRIAGVTIKVSASAVDMRAELYLASGGLPTGNALATSSPLWKTSTGSGEVTFTFSTPYIAASGTSLFFYVYQLAATFDPYYSSTSTYAGGSMASASGDGTFAADGSGDLYFKVVGNTATSFTGTNPLYAAHAQASATVNVDYLQRIPTDYACVIYRPSASGDLGIYYDGDTDTPYKADATTLYYAVYDRCEIRRPLRLKPGVTNRVVFGIGQGDTAVAGFIDSGLKYRWRPRYLSAVN